MNLFYTKNDVFLHMQVSFLMQHPDHISKYNISVILPLHVCAFFTQHFVDYLSVVMIICDPIKWNELNDFFLNIDFQIHPICLQFLFKLIVQSCKYFNLTMCRKVILTWCFQFLKALLILFTVISNSHSGPGPTCNPFSLIRSHNMAFTQKYLLDIHCTQQNIKLQQKLL